MKTYKWFAAGLLTGIFMLNTVQAQQSPEKKIGEMIGADISFLPELESKGRKFYENGVEKDAIAILKDKGFNYIRLRIFNDPGADSGYSPHKGFCDLEHTKQMALRIKKAGLKFLLDFHYSDTWADPQKQFKPSAWAIHNFTQLSEDVHDFTKKVLSSLKEQGTLPDMVQVGNEINHGMIWPDGAIKNLDTLTDFLKAGIAAVKETDPSIIIMLHIACGGQNQESRFFIDNMLQRGVIFDVIGESYYPRWHGTTDDLKNNLTDLATRYKQDIIIVEYSQKKQEVNDIAFTLPGNKGKGTCIWEPLSWGETFFDREGKSNDLLDIYPVIHKKYAIK